VRHQRAQHAYLETRAEREAARRVVFRSGLVEPRVAEWIRETHPEALGGAALPPEVRRQIIGTFYLVERPDDDDGPDVAPPDPDADDPRLDMNLVPRRRRYACLVCEHESRTRAELNQHIVEAHVEPTMGL